MFEGLRFNHWKAASAEGIVTLGMDRADKSVNALSRAMLDELDAMLDRLAIDPPKAVVIHSLKRGGFAVGADLEEFRQYEAEGTVHDNIRFGQRVFQRLAALPCPTVAAIHGHCMGGGTEMALACDARVASDDVGIALPEVLLGIHPGWGGTARLPRLVGAPQAMAMMLAGKTVHADKALSIGLIDRITRTDDLLAHARVLSRDIPQRPLAQRFAVWWSHLGPVRPILAMILRKRTAAKVRRKHYPAPFALIDVWCRGRGNIQQRLRLEADSVARLAGTPTAHQLIRVFFLRDRLRRQAGDCDHGIQRLHVVGAGVMGGDIAAWSAWKGFDVTLQDQDMKHVRPALERGAKLFSRTARGDGTRVAEATARLQADVDGKALSDADLVIEAIFENADAKRALYERIEPALPATALLATNTSSIALDDLRSALARPQAFLGLHFFNPVARMPLVEVVCHDQLDPDVRARALAFCKAIGKLPVAVRGTPGFLVNRILMPYLLEALTLYQEGVPIALLDRIARNFGMPMGPVELADTVGLDVCMAVGRELAPVLGLDLPAGMESRIENGHRGKKDGQGLYTWRDGKPVKPLYDRQVVAPDDTLDRMILPMINEAVACLHEGVVADADLLDAGAIFGTGFAPFRGGPIQYVRNTGADRLKARLEELATHHGRRFQPRPGWDSPALRD